MAKDDIPHYTGYSPFGEASEKPAIYATNGLEEAVTNERELNQGFSRMSLPGRAEAVALTCPYSAVSARSGAYAWWRVGEPVQHDVDDHHLRRGESVMECTQLTCLVRHASVWHLGHWFWHVDDLPDGELKTAGRERAGPARPFVKP